MEIRYSKSALRFLSKQDEKSRMRIREAINGLTETPAKGDIKPLQGYSDGRLRLRLGGWRIIYRYDKENKLRILMIIDIDNRGGVYK